MFFDGARDLWAASDIAVTDGAVTGGVDVALRRLGSVSGVITETDGTPYPGADVYLYASVDGAGPG